MLCQAVHLSATGFGALKGATAAVCNAPLRRQAEATGNGPMTTIERGALAAHPFAFWYVQENPALARARLLGACSNEE